AEPELAEDRLRALDRRRVGDQGNHHDAAGAERRSQADRRAARRLVTSTETSAALLGRSATALRPRTGAFTRRRRKETLAAYLFLAPGFLLFALVILYPIAQAFRVSLYRWSLAPALPSAF